jgi:hypothetical protein
MGPRLCLAAAWVAWTTDRLCSGQQKGGASRAFFHDSSDMPRMEKANLCGSQGLSLARKAIVVPARLQARVRDGVGDLLCSKQTCRRGYDC